jgi:protein gp37
MVPQSWREQWPTNAWIGTTVESQEYVSRIDHLARIPAPVRFISAEPLLGLITFGDALKAIDWVIVGGESGSKARPMQALWAQHVAYQAYEDGAAFWFKQWGEWINESLAYMMVERGILTANSVAAAARTVCGNEPMVRVGMLAGDTWLTGKAQRLPIPKVRKQ